MMTVQLLYTLRMADFFNIQWTDRYTQGVNIRNNSESALILHSVLLLPPKIVRISEQKWIS